MNVSFENLDFMACGNAVLKLGCEIKENENGKKYGDISNVIVDRPLTGCQKAQMVIRESESVNIGYFHLALGSLLPVSSSYPSQDVGIFALAADATPRARLLPVGASSVEEGHEIESCAPKCPKHVPED